MRKSALLFDECGDDGGDLFSDDCFSSALPTQTPINDFKKSAPSSVPKLSGQTQAIYLE